MRIYDVVLVLEPGTTETERKKLFESIKKWLGEAKVSKVNEWGKKVFARPVKKFREGFYAVLRVETEVIQQDVEKKLLMEGKVLRHLLIRR